MKKQKIHLILEFSEGKVSFLSSEDIEYEITGKQCVSLRHDIFEEYLDIFRDDYYRLRDIEGYSYTLDEVYNLDNNAIKYCFQNIIDFDIDFMSSYSCREVTCN